MKMHPRAEKKMRKVMREFKDGKLHSSSGKPVTTIEQAVAIAMSEAGMAKKKHKTLMGK